VIEFLRDIAQKSIALSARNMGAHIPPITLRTAGSMSPTGPLRRTSRDLNRMDPLVEPRDLLEEEVAMRNYLLKSTNLRNPTRK
jgi:hypothetical protein